MTSRFNCIEGWCQAITAVVKVSKKLLQDDPEYDFVCTRNFCQDPLENFFSTIRYAGGHRSRPDCTQFGDAFKKTCLMNILTPSQHSNCEADDDTVLLSDIIGRSFDQPIFVENVKISLDSVVKDAVTDIIEKNTGKYISSFFAKSIKEHHDCDTCQSIGRYSECSLVAE